MNFGEPPTESSFTPFPKGTIDIDDGLTHGFAGSARLWHGRGRVGALGLLHITPWVTFFAHTQNVPIDDYSWVVGSEPSLV